MTCALARKSEQAETFLEPFEHAGVWSLPSGETDFNYDHQASIVSTARQQLAPLEMFVLFGINDGRKYP